MENTYPNRCEEVLAHHGTKGMHWGIRRYQNPDGSLTAAGRRRMEKSDRRRVRDARFESKAIDRERKTTERFLKKAEKKYNKIKDSTKDTKRNRKIEDNYNVAKKLDEKVAKKQSEQYKKAISLTNDYIKQYGDKKIKDLRLDKNGRIDDHETRKVVGQILLGGATAPISILSPALHGMVWANTMKTAQNAGNKAFREDYKSVKKEYKQESKSERAIQKNADKEFRDSSRNVKSEVSKKEQKSNLKELSNLSKSSGFDKAMRKLNSDDSEGFTKEIDRIKEKGIPKSNTINKITQSKPVINAQKEHDKALSEWTKAQKELSDYVKKNGYPKSDKHSETTKDPVYNRLQAAADKAQDANSRAYDKLQKSIYSEMGKQIGKDPTADNLEAIRYMIELQIK